MKIFDTANLDERLMKTLSADDASWIYNGLDCCVTAEVYNELDRQISEDLPNVQETYATALAKLAPFFEMTLRGTRIDEQARQKSIKELQEELDGLDSKFQKIMTEVFGGPINWRSPLQLKGLFYTALGLKEIKARNQKGQYVATVNRAALEQMEKYLHARPIVRFVLIMRDLHKQLGFLKTEIDRDQRIRTNYNIAGTNTGRLASSMSDFGTGTNLQNVNRKLRYPFVSDAGMYLVNVDLEQADGRNVGAICWNLFYDMPVEEIYSLAKDDPRLSHFIKDKRWIGPVGQELAGAYLDACESGDLHTTVCRMTWDDLEWPADEKQWKKFCDGLIAHGQDSYRQLAKKLGHGTNYYGTPRTMAKHAHVPTKIIEDFQLRYFTRFPAIALWHNYVIREIMAHGTITTLFGRRRMFFGRANDASTHRKAIAYEPQSMTGEEIDRGLLAVWRKHPEVQLLNQVHDSILFQVPFRQSAELLPDVLETMKVKLQLKGGREFFVPLEAAGGWNWGYAVQYTRADFEKGTIPEHRIGDFRDNRYGLIKWTGKEERAAPNPQTRLSDYLRNVKTG